MRGGSSLGAEGEHGTPLVNRIAAGPPVRSRRDSSRRESNLESAGLSEAQRTALRAFCDTIVPSIQRSDDPDGFWARKATDLAVDQGVEQIIQTLPPELQAGLGQLL